MSRSIRRWFLLAALGSVVALAVTSGVFAARNADQKPAKAAIDVAPAFSIANLQAPPRNDWITNGGSITNDRYSALRQVNSRNVKGMKLAYITHLGGSGVAAKYSAEGTPLVYHGIMYASTGNDDVFAMNARTGEHIWTYHSNTFQHNDTVCCGWDNRGVALGDGRIYIAQLDGTIVALNQETGRVVWKTVNVRWQEGYTETMAPLYYDGKIFVGVSGGEFGARGHETAYDAKTGSRIWRFYTCPQPGEVGGNTWTGDEWQHCGATIWNTPTVDPKLGLLYFTTDNTDPWSGRGPGSNLFANSFVALDVNTGQYRWHFQTVHHDIWDFDQPSPTVLFDVRMKGRIRHGIAEPGKTGWVYILDRVTGKPLVGIPEQAVPQSKQNNTWATQPVPKGQAFAPQCAPKSEFAGLKGPDGKPFLAGGHKLGAPGCIFAPYDTKQFVATAPSALGGNNWVPMSYNPYTQSVYVCASKTALAYKLIPPAKTKYVEGKGYVGISFGFGKTKDFLGLGGTVTAMRVASNTIRWQMHTPRGCYSGTTTTAGNLVFVGLDQGPKGGLFVALNARNGKMLWSYKTKAGISAPAMTYAIDGKQYVSVYAGGTSVSPASKHGDAIYTFALK